MINFQIVDLELLIAFWLCFIRWSTVLLQIPLFDDTSVPVVLKVLFSLIVSYCFFANVQNTVLADVQYFGVNNIVFLTIGEALVGLALGFLVNSFLTIFHSAGTLMAQQIGFGAIRYFDPNMGGQTGPLEKMISWTILIMIITSGALLPIFKGIYTSFFNIHISTFFSAPKNPEILIHIFKSLFAASLFLATPILITNLVTVVVMGIISRSVPQMNILIVSFIINIVLGLLVIINTSHEFFNVGFKLYTDFLGTWFQLVS
ncbi:MAG: flagellar biosynthetic protein FliR [Bdellovibrionota bacterium]